MKEFSRMDPVCSRLFALIAISACCAVSSTCTIGQVTPHGKPPVAEVHKHFQAAIDALAAKWHIAIVAESAPIMENAGADISASQPNETVDTAVERVAAAFDYKLKRRASVFILNKLFTDPNDLPDLTLEEAGAALGDVLQILPAVDEKYLMHSLEADYAAMPKLLSRDQLDTFNHGGVPISSLSEAQHDEAWHLCNAMEYSQLVDEAEDAKWFIESAIAREPRFHWKEIYQGFNEFGFDADAMKKLPSGERRRVTVLKPLSHPIGANVFRDGFVGCCIVMKDINVPMPDPTEPVIDPATVPKRHVADGQIMTFAQASAQINKAGEAKARCLVDRELADKTVTLSGIMNVPSAQIAEAMADVYGLQTRHRTNGGITIARRTRPHINASADVIPALHAVIPDSLLRCTAAHLAGIQVSASKAQLKRFPGSYGMAAAGSDVANVASRKIRTDAEPLAALSGSKQVALSALDLGSRNVLAVSQSGGAFGLALDICGYGAPVYLIDFDHAVLAGTYFEQQIEQHTGSVLTFHLTDNDPKTGKQVTSRDYTVMSGMP